MPSDELPDTYCALVADAVTFGRVESLYGLLLARCEAELAALNPTATAALRELVALQREGLTIAATQQAETQTHN